MNIRTGHSLKKGEGLVQIGGGKMERMERGERN